MPPPAMTREAGTGVRWPAWLAAVTVGLVAILALRPEGSGTQLSRVIVYTFQVLTILGVALDRVARRAAPGDLPWAVALASVCVGVEVLLISDRQFFCGTDGGVELYVLQPAYFMLVVPWATGLAFGSIAAVATGKV